MQGPGPLVGSRVGCLIMPLLSGLTQLLLLVQGLHAAASIRLLPGPSPALQQVLLWACKEPAALPHPAMLLHCQIMHSWVSHWLHAADLMRSQVVQAESAAHDLAPCLPIQPAAAASQMHECKTL